MKTFNDETYQKRQLELSNRMIESNCDLFFCPPSSDLEYLTGTLRRKPTFGNISYTHGWVCGAFFRPFQTPLFVLPRMVAEFDMPHGATGEKIIIKETDDGSAVFEKIIKDFGIEPEEFKEQELLNNINAYFDYCLSLQIKNLEDSNHKDIIFEILMRYSLYIFSASCNSTYLNKTFSPGVFCASKS